MTENRQGCRHYEFQDKNNSAQSPIADEETAMQLARQCLVNVTCDNCDLCLLFCPDLCITRSKQSGLIEIDYNYCKGCGICAFICPKKAISMVRE